MSNKLSRRHFLGGGMTAVAALLSSTDIAFPQAAGSGPFTQPPLETSKNGILQTQLRVVQADVPIPGSHKLERTRCYNGSIPGPTLRLRAGEQLRLKLSNDLARQDEHCGKELINKPHCFNTTNIHTHGLHVSPQGSSDNSFVRVEPQSEFQSCFQLPEKHPAGTFWYHAHVHGSTGLQTLNGMSGALIIEEPESEKLVSEASDLIWLVQELASTGAEKLYTCDHPHAPYTVNGKFQPTLTLRPGEVQRWRFINASASPGGYMDLQLLDSRNRRQQYMVTSIDGYPLRRRLQRTSYILPPGGRVDFLVRLRQPGKYKMLKRRFQGQSRDQVLAFVETSGRSLTRLCPRQCVRCHRF